ncbi:NaCP60E [Symbiodinium sp. CCMP2456]|nr:NaCP60E [Symbiodinium sp. CCMP2456]
MVSTLVLVVLSLYIAACLGIEIITKDSDLTSRAETASIVSQHFGSLSSTLLTLTAFVTVDSISPIYGPLIASKPGLAGYFFFIVLFVSIALMNLVTAVLVEGALANASADKEMERMDLREKLRSEMPRLSQIFDEIDKDSSGTLTMDEMAMVPVDIIPEELRSKSRVSSMQEVFEMLDVDGGGELTREEFVDGLLNLFMHDDPATSVQTLRLLRKVDMKVMHLTHEIQEVVGRARNP